MKVIKIKFFPGKRNFANTNAANDAVSVCSTVIGSLQVFDQAYVLTKGGPGDSSSTMVFYIWQNAFQKMDMGYGTTLALLLFVFVMIVTVTQMVLSKKWVFYN